MGKERVLIIGHGAREHALYEKVRRSSLVERVIVASGTAGIPAEDREFAHVFDRKRVVEIVRKYRISLVIASSEQALVEGLGDTIRALENPKVAFVGPNKDAARLEGSKAWAMRMCEAARVPIPRYEVAEDYGRACELIGDHDLLVVKADELYGGKGVTVAHNRQEAFVAAKALLYGLNNGYPRSRRIVLQRKLEGYEASFFAFVDGHNIVMSRALTARDYKRLGDGDMGPNTSGMGAVAPHPLVTEALLEEVRTTIVEPIIRYMHECGTPFHGVLYAGVMVTADGPKLIEFNVRFGDPETQAMLPLIQSDVVPYLIGTTREGGLSGLPAFEARRGYSVCTVFATGNYPDVTTYGSYLGGLDEARAQGTAYIGPGVDRAPNGSWHTEGGRAASLVAVRDTVTEAATESRRLAGLLGAARFRFRTDIGS